MEKFCPIPLTTKFHQWAFRTDSEMLSDIKFV